MTESSPSKITSPSPNRGVKRGLPSSGLLAAEDAANKLWNVARLATTSQDVFARQFGEKTKASGGRWRTRMAMLRGFKLIHTEGEQVGLTELGQHLVNSSDPEGQIAARRAAVMNLKAYRELVEAYNGTELPDIGTLASRLQFDYGKSGDFATKAAKAFIDSLQHAQMIDVQNFVRRDGAETTPSSVVIYASEPTSIVRDSEIEDDEAAAEIDRSDDGSDRTDYTVGEVAAVASISSPTSPAAESPSPEANISLSMKLDLSKYRSDEVIEILNTLGFGRS